MITVTTRPPARPRPASPLDYGNSRVHVPESQSCHEHGIKPVGFGGTEPAMVLDRGGRELCPACAATWLRSGIETLAPLDDTGSAAETVYATLRAEQRRGEVQRATAFMAGLRAALESDDLRAEIRRLLDA